MLKNYLTSIFKSATFFKVSLLSSVSSGLRILVNFIIGKFLAVMVGPIGFAVIGQLNNFISIIHAFGSAGVNLGLTKFVSQYHDQQTQQQKFVRSAFYLMLLCTFFASVTSIVFSRPIANYLFGDEAYSKYIILISVVLLLYNIGQLLLAIVNGFKLFNKFILSNVLISLSGLGLSVVGIYFYQLQGAIYATILNLIFYLVWVFFYVRKEPWFKWELLKPQHFKEETKRLLSFSFMFLISASVIPFVQLVLRTFISEKLSVIDAGYWEALNRISQMSILVLTSAFSTYYMPQLAQTKTHTALKAEVYKTFKWVMIITIGILLPFYLFREVLVNLLLNKSFALINDLFAFQLLGDLFRMLSFVFAYVLLAKAKTWQFVFAEVFFGLALLLSTLFFIPTFGLLGSTYAYFLSYFLYFILVYILFRNHKWNG